MTEHKNEVIQGERFEFGKNWQAFLFLLDDERISEAQKSLKSYLGEDSLQGQQFLDIGSGSGLFSLAARRLGATVHSIDYDPASVACTKELKKRYFDGDQLWTIEQGSVLDTDYLNTLPQFDVVYSWGVLHHTGAMWEALDNAHHRVKAGGKLFISIYNHQIHWTVFYTALKRAYNKSPQFGKWLISFLFIGFEVVKGFIKDLILMRNPIARYRSKKKTRGMSVWHDWIDWIGGYPFEVAKPEEIFDFYRDRGYSIIRLRTEGAGYGCNEYVFLKQAK